MRDDFSAKTKQELADRANNQCSNPSCRRSTSGPKSNPNGAVKVGMAAHITAASQGFARYDDSLTPAQRKDITNGIWCCYICGKMIDDDADGYPVQLLRKWKAEAEYEAWEGVERPNSRRSTLGHHTLAADQRSLKALIALLPTNGTTIERLRNYDFGGVFDDSWFEPLRRFSYQTGPEYEFLDNELEKLRVEMLSLSAALFKTIAFDTFIVSGSNMRKIPDEWEETQSVRYKRTRDTLNDTATETVGCYENLLRLGRRRLGV